MAENSNSIKDVNEQLKVMVLKPGMATRARTSSGDPILYCDKCSYSCALKHLLNIHKMSSHSDKINPIRIAASKRKLSPNKSLLRVIQKKKTVTVESVKTDIEQTSINTVTTYPCTKCGFIYNSDTDLACHMSLKHAVLTSSKEKVQKVKVPEVKVDQRQQAELDNIDPTEQVQPGKDETTEQGPTTNMIIKTKKVANNDAQEKEQQETEEFLDKEKEKLYTEAENWRKNSPRS